MPACPVCSYENVAAAKFCSECGAALSAEPPREERKVVTVLFADLVGFTSRAEQLDPEDVRAVLAPYWERLRGELEKRGGTVEKFIGDAVMALFGAPVAHDDDPLRALGAALAIRDWARDEGDVQVRIAVNTGEALVLLGARPAEGEGMAAGDVVNTTARLQSAAPVNGVLVGETTYRATRDVIEYREHEPVVAKGKADPIAVWEAVQVRSRLGVDVESRPLLPMIGRARELGVIVDAFERAKAQREPQLVTLVGVPGIGKSRLVGEFFARLEDDPDLVWWRQGRALPYGEGVALWALAEMVKAQAGIDENDAAGVALAKLAASVDPLVEADERDWVVRHLAPLVGGEPGSSGGESAPAWRRYFEGMAEQRPLVLVFEDMHWADDTLLDFVDHLVEWSADVPLLVIATARPELLDRRPGWAGGKLNTSTIVLTPLTDDESAQIIHGVLDQAVLPAETQHALLDRAGGNPLYAEQFALLYMERGSAEELPLPETVHGLIAARLDGLNAEEKRVVQDGAVYGKVFWAGAVGATPATVHALERKGLLRRDRRSSVGGETQYAFRHVLVRDVAYGQIPRAVRGGKHLAAAEWIERLGRADDHAELLAHHLLAAESFGVAADDRTRHALRRAGTRAVSLGVFPAAARHLAAALERWPEDDDRASVLAEFAIAQIRANGDDSYFEPAAAALESASRFEEAVELAAFAAMQVWYQSSRHEVAQAWLERGRRLLERIPAPSRARASLLAETARQAIFDGDYARADELSAEALELATKLGLDDLRATLMTTTGVLAMTDGDLDAARTLFDDATALASPGSPPRFRALANRATVESLYGDFDAWRPRHAAALEEALRAGDRPNIIWLEANSVYAHQVEGRWDEALRVIESIVAGGRMYADRSQFLIRAMILADRGDVAEARKLRDEALFAVDGVRENQVLIPVHSMAAWVSLELGDTERGHELATTALGIILGARNRAPGVNAYSPLLMMRTGNGERWRPFIEGAVVTPRTAAARLTLDRKWNEAAEAWRRVSPQDEAMVRLHAARELAQQGNSAEAHSQLERGLAFYRAVGATRVVREAEALLGAAAAAE